MSASIEKRLRDARIPTMGDMTTLAKLGFHALRKIVEEKHYLIIDPEGKRDPRRKSYALVGNSTTSNYMACVLMAKELCITGETVHFISPLAAVGSYMAVQSGREDTGTYEADSMIVIPDFNSVEALDDSRLRTALASFLEDLADAQRSGCGIIVGNVAARNVWPADFDTWLDWVPEIIDIA